MRLKLSPSGYEKWNDDVMCHEIPLFDLKTLYKGQQDKTNVPDPDGCNQDNSENVHLMKKS